MRQTQNGIRGNQNGIGENQNGMEGVGVISLDAQFQNQRHGDTF